MKEHHSRLLLTLTFLCLSITVQYVGGKRFFIIPSPDSPCPVESTEETCFTLNRYIQTQTSRSSDILELQPGNHTLDTELYASQVSSFSLKGSRSSLYCESQFFFSDITRVDLSGIKFINCGMQAFTSTRGVYNVDTVASLNIENSIFQSEKILQIISSSSVTIINSTFTGAIGNAISIRDSESSVVVKQCTFSNSVRAVLNTQNIRTSIGGALSVSRSPLTVEQSIFMNNEGAIRFQGRDGTSVRIINSTFINNSLTRAISIDTDGEPIVISGCTFTNNRGGGVTASGRGSTLSVKHSIFNNNVWVSGGGGAIYATLTNVSIFNSSFNHNVAKTCAVLDVQFIRNGFVSIEDSTFSHNFAMGDAGVLQVEGSTVSVQGSYFDNNTAGGDGGVITTKIFPSTLTVSDTVCTDNEAGVDGGVAYVGIPISTLNFSNNLLENNRAGDRGGSLATAGSVVWINETTFIGNKADSGDAISACNSEVTLHDTLELTSSIDPIIPLCVLYSSVNNSQTVNTTSTISPLPENPVPIRPIEDTLYILPSTASFCPGEFTGGHCLTLNRFFSQPSFSMNTIFELQPGIHVFQCNSRIAVDDIASFTMRGINATVLCNCSFPHNVRPFHRQIRIEDVDNVSISGINFINCSGAALFSVGNFIFENSSYLSDQPILIRSSSANIFNSTFSTASGSGDTLLEAIDATLIIKQTTFSNNSRGFRYPGGAIHATDSTVTVEQSTFIDNRGRRRSGGIDVTNQQGGVVTITDCTFIDNVAVQNGYGGAVHVVGGELIVSGSTFTKNMASNNNGGAIHIDTSTSVSISHSNFINNLARSGRGGAVYILGNKNGINVSILNTTFDYNSAVHCGALDVQNISGNLVASTFTYNSAHQGQNRRVTGDNVGGVACISDSTVSVLNSTFRHNSAVGDAGVIQVENSTVVAHGSKFDNNSAGRNGGVLSTELKSVYITFNQSSFTSNRAMMDGGVIHVNAGGSRVIFGNCTLGDNKAYNRGGAIAIRGSTLEVDETEFSNNTAKMGGAISACSSEVTLPDELFTTTDPTQSHCTLYDDSITVTTSPPTQAITSIPTTDPSTTAIPMEASTTATPNEVSATDTPTKASTKAETNTTAIPTEESTTATPTEASTTAIPTETSTTATPTEANTTAIPTEASTTATPTEASTTAIPTEASTTAIPTEASTIAILTEASTTATPIEVSITATRTEASKTASPTEASTTAISAKASTAATPTEASTTATPTETSTMVTNSPTKASTTATLTESSTTNSPMEASTTVTAALSEASTTATQADTSTTSIQTEAGTTDTQNRVSMDTQTDTNTIDTSPPKGAAKAVMDLTITFMFVYALTVIYLI